MKRLQDLEKKFKVHVYLTTEHLETTHSRMEQLEENYDGTPEMYQAINGLQKLAGNLQNDQVASSVVFAQAESNRRAINIVKVLTSDNSNAYVGLPASIVGRVNLRVKEVTAQARSTSHVRIFGEIKA